MDYQRIYNTICSTAKSQNRIKGQGVYYEAHHIIPVCLGGEGKVGDYKKHPNVVLLTAKEHFVAHKLLYFIHPDNKSIFHGYRMMAKMTAKTNSRDFNLTGREYEEIRVKFAESVSGDNAPSKRPEVAKKISESQIGKEYSEETIQKISVGMKEYAKMNGPWNKGIKASDEVKKKLSDAKKGKPGNINSITAMANANRGRKRSPETIEKMRIAALNRKPMTEETKNKISLSVSKSLMGRECSQETRDKISNTLKGHVKFNKGEKYITNV